MIEVKAFGINHAEMHMRKGEWAEIADVSGIECVGLIKSCPGGEFAIGTKVAALMGGLGRTINGSYAEFTRAPVSNVAAIESDLSWADLAAIPETYATAWTCLFRNLEIADGQTLVIRGATSSFGQAAVNMAVNEYFLQGLALRTARFVPQIPLQKWECHHCEDKPSVTIAAQGREALDEPLPKIVFRSCHDYSEFLTHRRVRPIPAASLIVRSID